MNSSFDAIVVGSGAGGAAATYRLVKAGLRVLLLEKGASLPRDGSTLDVGNVVADGRFLSREPWIDGAGKRLVPEEHFNVGGKTKWYGAALFRFGDHEFTADAAHGCRAWPIDATELAPYYTEAEQLLGVRRFAAEPDLARIVRRLSRRSPSWRAEPMPMGLAPAIAQHADEAAHFDGFASPRDLKGDAQSALLRRLGDHPALTLREEAEVETLVGAPGEPTRIVGVRLRNGNIFRAPRVFLAAGALHSPRIASHYLRANGLDDRLPAAAQVGRHLKLHLLTAMVAFSPGVKTDLIRKTTVMLNDRYPHSTVQPLGFDSELIATLMPRLVPQVIRTALSRRAYGFFLQTEDGSHADNRVLAGNPPTLDFSETRIPQASREHRAFTRAMRFALGKAGLVSITRRIGINGTAHACGSMICGASPQDSVVNARGLVHGLEGLYVVDGSVLPRSGRVNPALTIYAWGLRIGDQEGLAFQRERGTCATETPELSHAE